MERDCHSSSRSPQCDNDLPLQRLSHGFVGDDELADKGDDEHDKGMENEHAGENV